MQNNDSIEISLPRHVARWLFLHCDNNLARLSACLPYCNSADDREFCLSEMKIFNLIYGQLEFCVDERGFLFKEQKS